VGLQYRPYGRRTASRDYLGKQKTPCKHADSIFTGRFYLFDSYVEVR
jgi:hypothetical protein